MDQRKEIELYLLKALITAIKPDGSINDDIVMVGGSYRWMADKVEEYSTAKNDYMALAASEFRKIAKALDAALKMYEAL